MKTGMVCNECGKKFSRTIKKNTYEIRCPKCRGYDTEPDYVSIVRATGKLLR